MEKTSMQAFESSELWRQHLHQAHGKKLEGAHFPLLATMSEKKVLDLFQCPLCLPPRRYIDIEQDDHIALHLHSFALNALTNRNDISIDNGSEDTNVPQFAPIATDPTSGSGSIQNLRKSPEAERWAWLHEQPVIPSRQRVIDWSWEESVKKPDSTSPELTQMLSGVEGDIARSHHSYQTCLLSLTSAASCLHFLLHHNLQKA
jgi:hypothetical protein